jgi:acyl-CoA reductase-like NAD-dependent aldehyde dehydrogenase
MEVVNPATESMIAEVADATVADARLARRQPPTPKPAGPRGALANHRQCVC